jgi:DNA-binding MarR family transcriptional regulator
VFIRGKFAVKIKEAILSASKTRIYFQLQRAAHRLKVEADAVLAEAGGLTTAQAAIMSIIAKDGPVAQKYIAEKLSQRESAITAMAARLLKAGYITKIRSQADARAWELEVTDAGRQALNGMQKQFAKINAKLVDKIDHSEMQRLAASLDKIIQAIES